MMEEANSNFHDFKKFKKAKQNTESDWSCTMNNPIASRTFLKRGEGKSVVNRRSTDPVYKSPNINNPPNLADNANKPFKPIYNSTNNANHREQNSYSSTNNNDSTAQFDPTVTVLFKQRPKESPAKNKQLSYDPTYNGLNNNKQNNDPHEERLEGEESHNTHKSQYNTAPNGLSEPQFDDDLSWNANTHRNPASPLHNHYTSNNHNHPRSPYNSVPNHATKSIKSVQFNPVNQYKSPPRFANDSIESNELHDETSHNYNHIQSYQLKHNSRYSEDNNPYVEDQSEEPAIITQQQYNRLVQQLPQSNYFAEDEEEAEAAQPVQTIVQKYFLNNNQTKKQQQLTKSVSKPLTSTTKAAAQLPSKSEIVGQTVADQQSSALDNRLKELQAEIARYQRESARLHKLNTEQATELKQIKEDSIRQKQRREEEEKLFHEFKAEEMKKLKQTRIELDKEKRKLQQQPERKERQSIDQLRDELQRVHLQFKEREDKYKSTIITLRNQLQGSNQSKEAVKQERIKLEQERLDLLEAQEKFNRETNQSFANKSKPTAQPALDESKAHSVKQHNLVSNVNETSLTSTHNNSTVNAADNNVELEELDYRQLLSTELTVDEAQFEVVDTVNHPGGKQEYILADENRLIIFPNATRKLIYSDGHVRIVFPNNDMKLYYPSAAATIYYYNTVGTVHITYERTGLQIYEFANQQVEKHYSNGVKQIFFPDGSMKLIK
jgi:hypothetical protein